MFKVTFPDSIPVPQVVSLKAALPSPTANADDADMDAETQMLQAFTESQRNTKAGGGQQDDSDEEQEDGHGQGGQRVQCAQQ